jgi:hypothetical protein
VAAPDAQAISDGDPTLDAWPRTTRPLGEVVLRCQGRGCDDQVTWRAQDGSIDGTGAEVTWRAPGKPGVYRLELETGTSERALALLQVVLPARASIGERHPGDAAASAGDRAAEIERLYRAIADDQAGGMAGRLARRSHQAELAPLLLAGQRYEEALAVYYDLILQYPRTSGLSLAHRRGYGMAAFFLGRDAEAIQALIDAGGENDYESFYYLGQLLEQAGRKGEAVGYYLAGARRRPRFADPWLRAALLAAELGDTGRAAEILIEAGPGVGRQDLAALVASDPEKAALAGLVAQLGPERLADRGNLIVDTEVPESESLGVHRVGGLP